MARVAGVLFALVPFTVVIFTGLGWWTEQASRVVDILDGRASVLGHMLANSFLEGLIRHSVIKRQEPPGMAVGEK